ncbi:Nn.00g084930.m01.CDS01 [Neocucurbitaria sp. VM-36]
MDSKYTQKSKQRPTQANSSTAVPDLPHYYDSEPSSQPPQYGKVSSSGHARSQSASQQQSQSSDNGASAATVAAVLASPSAHLEEKGKKSFRERWSDWKERNFKSDGYYGDYGSSSTWNMQGVSIKTWSSTGKRGWR